MLRMMLLGLLIPLGVGVLSAKELRTPPRNTAAVAQPVAETIPDLSDSQGVLAKADRLEIAAVSTEAPAPPASADRPVAPPEEASIIASQPSTLVGRDRRDPKPTKFTAAARPESKSRTFANNTFAVKKVARKAAAVKPAAAKAADLKQTAIAQRRATSGADACRLRAFGGLLRALNSIDCEI